jgi:serine/threonine protein kinase
MDYIGGGELFHHIQLKTRFKENEVKFLAIQMILAMGYLHKELNVIYRDLKPENIILDKHGYLKLTDFGLSKQAEESNTFCGTPEYVSPEMLAGTGHDKTVDWWALGILIYELLSGIPPFYDKDHSVMFENI